MMSLWLAMTGLSLMVAGFILWPLWRHHNTRTNQAELSAAEVNARQQANIALFHEHLAELDLALAEGRIGADQYEQLKLEQERALLDDEDSMHVTDSNLKLKFGGRELTVAALGMIALGLLLYFQLGSSSDLRIQRLQVEKSRLDYQDMLLDREPDPVRTQALLAEVEAKLKDEPDNAQYWFVLARTALEIPDYEKAVSAYQKILALSPRESTVMAELAQAMFMRDQNRMSPAIAELAHKALELDPQNTVALGLAGIDAFHRQEFAATVKYWQRAVDIMGPNAAGSSALLGGIARAKQQLAAQGPVAATPPESDSPGGSARKIQLKVSIGESVNVSPDQVVFVYARAWQGPKMPLAITRMKVSDMPATIILDETMAMSTMSSLAQADKVEVVARISSDGTAIAKPGDWQASFGPLDMKAIPAETSLVIDQKLSE